MLPNLVRWYHEMTVYVEGADCLCQTMTTHFFHPHLLMNVNGRLMLLRFAIACGLDTANMAFLLLAMQICSPGMMSMLIQQAHGLSKLMVLTLPTRHSLVSTLSIISLRFAMFKIKLQKRLLVFSTTLGCLIIPALCNAFMTMVLNLKVHSKISSLPPISNLSL